MLFNSKYTVSCSQNRLKFYLNHADLRTSDVSLHLKFWSSLVSPSSSEHVFLRVNILGSLFIQVSPSTMHFDGILMRLCARAPAACARVCCVARACRVSFAYSCSAGARPSPAGHEPPLETRITVKTYHKPHNMTNVAISRIRHCLQAPGFKCKTSHQCKHCVLLLFVS